eukprot:227383-Pyramimonas_sp.AAC.1
MEPFSQSKSDADSHADSDFNSDRSAPLLSRPQGVEAKQFDAVDIGFACTDDDYENGEILPETYPAVKRSLMRQAGEEQRSRRRSSRRKQHL